MASKDERRLKKPKYHHAAINFVLQKSLKAHGQKIEYLIKFLTCRMI